MIALPGKDHLNVANIPRAKAGSSSIDYCCLRFLSEGVFYRVSDVNGMAVEFLAKLLGSTSNRIL